MARTLHGARPACPILHMTTPCLISRFLSADGLQEIPSARSVTCCKAALLLHCSLCSTRCRAGCRRPNPFEPPAQAHPAGVARRRGLVALPRGASAALRGHGRGGAAVHPAAGPPERVLRKCAIVAAAAGTFQLASRDADARHAPFPVRIRKALCARRSLPPLALQPLVFSSANPGLRTAPQIPDPFLRRFFRHPLGFPQTTAACSAPSPRGRRVASAGTSRPHPTHWCCTQRRFESCARHGRSPTWCVLFCYFITVPGDCPCLRLSLRSKCKAQSAVGLWRCQHESVLEPRSLRCRPCPFLLFTPCPPPSHLPSYLSFSLSSSSSSSRLHHLRHAVFLTLSAMFTSSVT